MPSNPLDTLHCIAGRNRKCQPILQIFELSVRHCSTSESSTALLKSVGSGSYWTERCSRQLNRYTCAM